MSTISQDLIMLEPQNAMATRFHDERKRLDSLQSSVKSNSAHLLNQKIEIILSTSSTTEAKIEAARQLAKFGVIDRQGTQPRGNLQKPAESRLSEKSYLQKLNRLILSECDSTLRAALIGAMGEWGNTDTAALIQAVLRSKPEVEVQLSSIHALSLIGGRDGATGLAIAMFTLSDENWTAAVRELFVLATGGDADLTWADSTQPNRFIEEAFESIDFNAVMNAASGTGTEAKNRHRWQQLIKYLVEFNAPRTTEYWSRLFSRFAVSWPEWAVDALPFPLARIAQHAGHSSFFLKLPVAEFIQFCCRWADQVVPRSASMAQLVVDPAKRLPPSLRRELMHFGRVLDDALSLQTEALPPQFQSLSVNLRAVQYLLNRYRKYTQPRTILLQHGAIQKSSQIKKLVGQTYRQIKQECGPDAAQMIQMAGLTVNKEVKKQSTKHLNKGNTIKLKTLGSTKLRRAGA